MDRHLAQKIYICDQISSLSEEQCQKLFGVIKHQLNCFTTNDFLIKLLFFKPESLNDEFFNTIKTHITTIRQEHDQPDQSPLAIPTTNANHNEDTDSISSISSIDSTDSITSIASIASITSITSHTDECYLTQLPLEIMAHIENYLNSKEIAKYEQCNRILYMTGQNANILVCTNCTNRSLTINEKNIAYVAANPSQFNKYSKCNELTISIDFESPFEQPPITKKDFCDSGAEEYETKWLYIQIRPYFEQLVQTKWFSTLLTSIRVLNIKKQGLLVFGLLPVNLLFDQNSSHLEILNIEKYQRVDDIIFIPDVCPYTVFNNSYNQVYADMPKKMLKCIKFSVKDGDIYSFMLDFGRNFLHLHLNNARIRYETMLDITSKDVDCGEFADKNLMFHPHLKTLTVTEKFEFYIESQYRGLSLAQSYEIYKSQVEQKPETAVNIETLRLLSVSVLDCAKSGWVYPLLIDGIAYSTLNFGQTLKNLLIEFKIESNSKRSTVAYSWELVKDVIAGSSLSKLEDMILLFGYDDDCSVSSIMDLVNHMFTILGEIYGLLQERSLKTFYIGFKFKQFASTLKWDSKVSQHMVTAFLREWLYNICANNGSIGFVRDYNHFLGYWS